MATSSFILSNAVQLNTDLNGQFINLWTWFVVGNFAAVAAYFSAGKLSLYTKILFLIGFWLYAMGNLALIIHNLQITEALLVDISSNIKTISYAAQEYSLTISKLVSMNGSICIPIAFHLVVDICITMILLSHKKQPI